jgi:hypothetical protein
MKILITKEQFNLILKEQSEITMDRRFGIERTNMAALGLNPSNPSDNRKYLEMTYGKPLSGHDAATILQIATAFIPVIGPFLSMGIGLLDANSYYKEGNKTAASITAIFSLLPGMTSLALKIPGLRELGKKGMSKLASKILKKQPLTKTEKEVAESISKEKDLVTQELNKTITQQSANNEIYRIIPKEFLDDPKNVSLYVSKLKSLGSNLENLKLNYIKKYGQKEYDRFLKNFILGWDDIDKNAFLNTLKNVKNPNIRLKPVLGLGREHRVYESALYPNKIIKVELSPGTINKWYDIFNKRPDIFPKIFKTLKVNGGGGEKLTGVVLEKLDTTKFTKLWSEIDDVRRTLFKNLPVSEKPISMEGIVKYLKNPVTKKQWSELINSVKKQKPELTKSIDEFSKMVDELYKITPNPDIRQFNFGYDSQGVLKCLDI